MAQKEREQFIPITDNGENQDNQDSNFTTRMQSLRPTHQAAVGGSASLAIAALLILNVTYVILSKNELSVVNSTLLETNAQLSSTLDAVRLQLVETNDKFKAALLNCQTSDNMFLDRGVLGVRSVWNISVGDHLVQRDQFIHECKKILKKRVVSPIRPAPEIIPTTESNFQPHPLTVPPASQDEWHQQVNYSTETIL